MVSFTLSFICNYQPRENISKQECSKQYFPTQFSLQSGLQEYNKRRRWACGKEEKVGREEPGGRTVCGLWAGWVEDSILRDDFPALVQYSSTDAKRIQASKV